ncbi:hypothetical protein Esti_006808 [Eimeria stiedai]
MTVIVGGTHTTDAAADAVAPPRLPTEPAPASSSSNSSSSNHRSSSSSDNSSNNSSNSSNSIGGGSRSTGSSSKSSRISRSKDSSSSSGSSIKDGSMKAWTQEMENVMVSVCLRTLDYGTRKDLERRVRSGTGTEDKASQGCCGNYPQQHQQQQQEGSCCSKHGSHHHSHSNASADASKAAPAQAAGPAAAAAAAAAGYSFCKDETDDVGRRLDDWTSAERLRSVVGAVCERASKVYTNGSAADGLSVEKGDANDRHLHDTILKEALLRELQLRIAQEMRQERLMDSHEGGLLANPSGYQDGPLSFLRPETIRDLMVEGVAVQDGFVGEEMRARALRELELLDFDGRFNEVFQQSIMDVRKDFMCWTTTSDLDREKEQAKSSRVFAWFHQGLRHLLKCLFALPFELNKKANLCLQVGWVCQLAVFYASGAFYRKHLDGGFTQSQNNGRKITAIYYPNASDWAAEDGGELVVYRRRGRREQLENAESVCVPESEQPIKRIVPKGDRLVLLRSRDMPHEVKETFRKRFAVSLYITGPPGPGDD